MAWRFTNDVAVYADRTWDLLARSPAEHTIALSVIESVRGGHRPSGEPMLFGWYADRGQVRGAVWLTPPFELLLAVVPDEAVEELVAALRAEEVSVPGVNGDDTTVERFAAGVDRRDVAAHEDIDAPAALRARDPAASEASTLGARGRPRARGAVAARVPGRTQGVPHRRGAPSARADRRPPTVALGGPGGSSVSLAGRTAPAAGGARIALVYTPPGRRRHGYAAAVTAACTADALHRGADHVVLFTDLDDTTSNAVYQRIGYRPMSDRGIVRFAS